LHSTPGSNDQDEDSHEKLNRKCRANKQHIGQGVFPFIFPGCR